MTRTLKSLIIDIVFLMICKTNFKLNVLLILNVTACIHTKQHVIHIKITVYPLYIKSEGG